MTVMLVDTNIARWNAWRRREDMLAGPGRLTRYLQDGAMMRDAVAKGQSTRLYFGCGHDYARAKYSRHICCDVRNFPEAAAEHGGPPAPYLYDVTLGLPFPDASLDEVVTKLTLEFLSVEQARFVLDECARVLKLNGVLDATVRDVDRVVARYRAEQLSLDQLRRYIMGSQLYSGGYRRSLWTLDELQREIQRRGFPISHTLTVHRGMNAHVVASLVKRKKFKEVPVPEVEDVNYGADFHGKA